MSVYRLCRAARKGRLNDVRRLVERERIDPNAKDDMYTPLQFACIHNQLAVVQYLIEEAQADITITCGSNERTILFLTCDETLECLPVVRYLVERVGMSAHEPDRDGFTPLHDACKSGNLALIQYLIEQPHSNIEIKSLNGYTPLHCFCWWAEDDSLPIIRYLVETAGSNVNATDIHGRTALHLACLDFKLKCAQYLVEHGKAKVDTEDKHGCSPLTLLPGYDSTCWNGLILLFLTKVNSVGERVLRVAWEKKTPWDVKATVLRKFAVGVDLAEAFDKFPIHTIFQHFPLPTQALEECVERFPLAALSLLDHDGRLPLHVALVSRNDDNAKSSWRVVSALTRRLPRSLLFRDPITGVYPFAVAVLTLSKEDNNDDEVGWLSTMFGMLRMNPVALCHAANRRCQVNNAVPSSG